jgi:NADH-quinone oxidoreductase subunit C
MMNPELEPVIAGLQSAFGENIQSVDTFRDDTIVTVGRDAIVNVATWLRDNDTVKFNLCEDIFGIDMFERKNRFRVNYHFYSTEHKLRIHLTVIVDEDDAAVDTISGAYPSANWYERETYDMYGVTFNNHPDMRRAYMPEDFEYYPLRKDFPLMGIPGSLPLPKRS